MNQNIIGAILILAATTIWGSTGVFVKTLQLPSTSIVVFRLGIPLICVVCYLLYHKQSLGLSNKLGRRYSFRNAVRMLFYYIGFNMTTIANAVIGLYTWPLFAALIDYYRTRKITTLNLTCTILGLIGVIITTLNKDFGTSNMQLLGFLSIVIAAIISAFQRFEQKKLIEQSNNMQMILYQGLVGTIGFLPFLFINRPLPTVNQITLVSVFGFLIGVVGFYLYFTALRKISISRMSILSYFEVVSSIGFAYLFLDEIPSGYTIVGGSIIITVVITMSLYKDNTTK